MQLFTNIDICHDIPSVSQVGNRDDSNLYISMKLKAAAEVKNLYRTGQQTSLGLE